jgi:uncharacterized protein
VSRATGFRATSPGDERPACHKSSDGDDFIAGLVFYTGTQTLPFGPRLRAVPVSALWQA